jgi:hypothetical protein
MISKVGPKEKMASPGQCVAFLRETQGMLVKNLRLFMESVHTGWW